MRAAAACATALALLALVGIAGCADPAPRGRVLLVGIDGATLAITEPLIERGRLPNLARIAREGVHGPLRSHLPLWSPRIWTSIATGKAPEQHGILGFVRTVDGKRQLFRSGDRNGHALWNIASDAGLRVGVIGWWHTYPPEVIDGVMISDHALPGAAVRRKWLKRRDAPPESGPQVFPEDWQPRVDAILGADPDTLGLESPADRGDLPDWVDRERLGQRFREDAHSVELALVVEEAIRPDLLMVFLSGIDRFSHQLWGAVGPPGAYPEKLRFSRSQRRAGAEAIFGYYAYTDALIGRLLERFGPDDLVVIVSDHGFEAGVHFGTLTGVHDTEAAQNGVVFARGPGIPAGAAPGQPDGPMSVNDVTPTILSWLGLPSGEDMSGRTAAFLEGPVPARIATHDARTVERVGAVRSGAEDELIEQLEALGYIE